MPLFEMSGKNLTPVEQANFALEKELQTFVKTNTEPHKYPRTVKFVEDLPKTATGKIQRYKLRQMGAEETAAATS